MRKLFILGCLSVLLVFCSKDPTDPITVVVNTPTDTIVPNPGDTPTGPPPVPMFRKVTLNGNTSTEFFYNKKWQLAKTIIYRNPGTNSISSLNQYQYNYDGLLIRRESVADMSSSLTVPLYDSNYTTFFYDANKRVSEARTYWIRKGKSVFASRLVPEFDAKGRLVAESIYADSITTQFSTRTTHEYDDQDNVIKSKQFHSGFLSGTSPKFIEMHEYDQKKNPYRGKWVGVWGLSANNLLKTITTSMTVTPNTSSSMVMVIKTYNTLGYPTLVLDPNGMDYVYHYYQ